MDAQWRRNISHGDSSAEKICVEGKRQHQIALVSDGETHSEFLEVAQETMNRHNETVAKTTENYKNRSVSILHSSLFSWNVRDRCPLGHGSPQLTASSLRSDLNSLLPLWYSVIRTCPYSYRQDVSPQVACSFGICSLEDFDALTPFPSSSAGK